ncbi:MAG: hypothetical protein ABJB65_01375 [Chloroflexota bacterium]
MNRRLAAWGTALVAALVVLPASSVAAADLLPAEPGAIVLPPARTLQALAGDVDGDGNRELVRLVQDDSEATLLEVWRQGSGRWVLAGAIPVLSGQSGRPQRNKVYAGAPARLLAWNDGSAERVLIVTQPRFQLLDVGPACCLLIDEVVLDRAGLRLRPMGGQSNSVEAILAIDLNGDRTDELLTTRSLPPVGDISYPIEARVYRFDGDRFGQPTKVKLPFGSGDSPFLLGDTDGRRGQEAGLIGTLGPPGLFRIRLDASGTLVMDRSGLGSATAALAFAVRQGQAIAVTASNGVQIVQWPAAEKPRILAADLGVTGALATAAGLSGPVLLLETADGSQLRSLGRDLRFGPTIDAAPNAVLLSLRSLRAYTGPVPGGGYRGGSAAIFRGRLVGSLDIPAGRPLDRAIAPLVDAVPIGLVGEGSSSLALLHGDLFPRRLGRSGGVLEELKPSPDSWLSLAPIDELLRTSSPAGGFAPAIAGAVRDPSNKAALVTSAAGFRARFRGPPGSRAVIFGMGPTAQSVVPPSGLLSVPVEPPKSGVADRRIDAGLIVLTPAGQAYLADWNVQVLTTPPEVVTTAVTPFLSSQVRVTGHVPAGSRLTLNGRAVAVAHDGRFGAEVSALPWPMDVRLEASDPLGNRSTRVLSVVGFLDYRRLPWIPIVVLVIPAVAIALFLRGPRARRLPIAEGDARLEEIEEP